jgi:DNA-binding Lrp family transcriptional regulator
MSASQDFELCGLRVGEDLDYRQREVLSALSEDQKATYSFQGLRRKLGFHQEMLSRTLDRLEEENLVEKTHDGYRINAKVSAPHFDYVAEVTPIETQVVTAHLPIRTDVSVV